MRYQTIGTGTAARQVSAIALGAMKLAEWWTRRPPLPFLDRFVEAGGTFIDTANNYMYWEPGSTPDDSEAVIGRWGAARGISESDGIVVATKVGARPTVPGGGRDTWEGLSSPVVHAAVDGSLRRLRSQKIDLLYTHVEDRNVPLEETLAALAELTSAGTVACSEPATTAPGASSAPGR